MFSSLAFAATSGGLATLVAQRVPQSVEWPGNLERAGGTVHWWVLDFWLRVRGATATGKLRLEGCRTVLRLNGVRLNALHPLGPQQRSERGQLTARQVSEKARLRGLGYCLLCAPHLPSVTSRWGSGNERRTGKHPQGFLGARRASYLDDNFSRSLFSGHNLGWPSWNCSYQPRQGKYY